MRSGSSVLIIVGITIFACIIGTLLFIFTTVRTIETSQPIKKSVITPFLGTSIIFINENKIKKAILASSPNIASVSVQRRFPNTLFVVITKGTPALQLNDGKNYYLLDKNAFVLETKEASQSAIPIATFFQDLQSRPRQGDTIPNGIIKYAAQLAQTLQSDYKANLEKIVIADPMRIDVQYRGDNYFFIVSTQKSIAKNAFIVHNSRIELTKQKVHPRGVDLRFDKPIITK